MQVRLDHVRHGIETIQVRPDFQLWIFFASHQQRGLGQRDGSVGQSDELLKCLTGSGTHEISVAEGGGDSPMTYTVGMEATHG